MSPSSRWLGRVVAVDNPARRLEEGLGILGLTLEPPGVERLWAYAETLLRWNEKVNLTAITDPTEVVDKHLLDSLAIAPEVAGASTLLDLGAGAGLPGIPLAVALPALQCTLVDTVAKKVAFMKTGAVKAGVASRVRAVHQRVAGQPASEGLARTEVVISRAFMEVGAFVALAVHYLAPGGRIIAMLGKPPPMSELSAIGRSAGLELVTLRELRLPLSGDPRAVASFRASPANT